jgi:hypothetical protein
LPLYSIAAREHEKIHELLLSINDVYPLQKLWTRRMQKIQEKNENNNNHKIHICTFYRNNG